MNTVENFNMMSESSESSESSEIDDTEEERKFLEKRKLVTSDYSYVRRRRCAQINDNFSETYQELCTRRVPIVIWHEVQRDKETKNCPVHKRVVELQKMDEMFKAFDSGKLYE